MSVHKRTRNGKTTWEVRWREDGAQRSRTFSIAKDARDFDAALRRLAQQGELAHELRRRRTTIAEMVARWIVIRGSEVDEQTSEHYARHFERRILPRLGHRRVATLTPADIEEWIAWMRETGDENPTILKACTALQAVIALAVKDGTITANPVAAASKPPQTRTRTPQLITVHQVEVMRAWLMHHRSQGDVVLLELLAYAGLRPESEAIKLTWKHARSHSLLIQDTKRHRERTVPLVDPFRETLDAWRPRRPAGGALVIPPTTGEAWTREHWRNWRRRVFKPAAQVAGLPLDTRPRDLRGSLVSLLVHEGRSIVEVARILGHSPQVSLRDYAQVYDNVDPTKRIPASDAIRVERSGTVGMFDQSSPNAAKEPDA